MVEIADWNVEEFRKRIQAMSDEKLLETGKACASLADPKQAADRRTVRQIYVLHLKECRAEWRRRHLKEIYADTDQNTDK